MNITIHREDGGAFFVLHGDKFADGLTFDEMLGMVAALAMPANHPAPRWLRTASDFREDTRRSMARMAGMSDEPMLPAEMPTAAEMLDRSPAALREETIAIAVRQDGADDRVRADWAAVGDGRVTEFPIPADGEPDAQANVTPIRRADVRLKVGDVVEFKISPAGKVTDIGGEGGQPVCAGGFFCTAQGIVLGPHSEIDRIVSVNGRPIIDSEEA